MSYAQMLAQLERAIAKHPPLDTTHDEPVPTLYEFVKMAWHIIEPNTPFVDGSHIEALCFHLEAVTYGKVKRLLINMPPRHAKSLIVSVFWTVWQWLINPSHRWLCASYALSLAIRDNVKCRRLVQSDWFQERWGYKFRLQKDQNAKLKFENTKGGYRQAISTGSAATGEGAEFLLVDDLHAIDDKESDVKREGALDWFINTFSTRLNDKRTGAIVVVGQRIHANDISGYILSGETGEEWTHCNLPAEFEEANPNRSIVNGEEIWHDWREVEGDLLWEARFDADILAHAKKLHGAIGYAALYQQRPVPAGGATFRQEWFRYFVENETWYDLLTPMGDRRVFKRDCNLITTVDQTPPGHSIRPWAVTMAPPAC